MNEQITSLLERIRELQERLEDEYDKKRALYNTAFREKVEEIRKDLIARHRFFRQSLFRFIRTSSFLNIVTAPVIYSMIVPLAAVDLWATIYQHICFRAYGIPRVKRSNYIVVDRHHLAYLNGIEILNCVFCGYGNGVVAYVREIASRTEQYWCPIKHALRIRDPHNRYMHFLEYGDAESYRAKLEDYRREAQKDE